jgi:short subunit dehydrogenase-like uncharacterized protein
MEALILVYGCYGYTGRLIVDLAVKQNLPIALGGRDEVKVKEMASKYALSYEVFSTSDIEKLTTSIAKYKVVLNCAGPFFRTAETFFNACIVKGVHYLDITGEYQVFEMGASLTAVAKKANVMLLPGVGFDVVPSDCLANYLISKLPDADYLEMFLYTKGGRLSHGTAITVAESIGQKTVLRSKGELIEVPNGKVQKTVDWMGKKMTGTAISWGDISTAFHSTGIPNITIYNMLPPSVVKSMKLSNYFGFIVGSRMVKNYMIRKIKQQPAGPSEEQRKSAKTYIYGEVSNPKGKTATTYLELPEGYSLTAMTAVEIAKRVLTGDFKSGFQTPATAFGQDFIMNFEGVKRIDI